MRIPKRLVLAAAVGVVATRRMWQTPYDLSGKSVLITGGSRGLGLAMAREMAQQGAKLTLLARDPDELLVAAADLRQRGAQVHVVQGDVSVPQDAQRAVEEAARVFGKLDVVVNNAGIIQTGPLANMTLGDFERIMQVNAFGALLTTYAALPYLRATRGRILIVSSVGGKVAVPHLAPYSMSKFAALGLGQALRSELAQDGITVTTVCPGLMQTGSPRHAEVKGQHEAEYQLFATLDNLPLISLDGEVAAQQIVAALRRGDAQAMIGLPAQALAYAQALAPQLTADLMALGNRFLPGPASHNRSVKGAEAETEITRNNPLKRAAERKFNEG